ncbi:N-alpha-acetyltransferase 16, NatA auxiliary subunit [Dionaea muscipula]
MRLLYKDHGYVSLCGYTNADWAGSPDDRRTTGYCVFFGDNSISWKSKKQQTVVAKSSVESEYRAMVHTSCELASLKNLVEELGVVRSKPMELKCDNQGALHIAINTVFHEKIKHIEVDCHFVREKIQGEVISTSYMKSNDQLTDIFTEPLGGS